MPDGFEDIIEDHRKVLDLLERYEREPDDAVAREACIEIALHSEAEEMVLYPQLRRLGPGEEGQSELADGVQLADRAELEHSTVGAQVARVLAAPPIDLREPMGQIADQIRAHVAFEERDLLPQLRPVIDADELHRALADAKDGIRSRAGEPMF